ncbi:MAG: hypothetical protein FOGNACKC_04446 [Anaerolineae bacterium]|nr:hypothetical protein [Anaerolineae bacterium]
MDAPKIEPAVDTDQTPAAPALPETPPAAEVAGLSVRPVNFANKNRAKLLVAPPEFDPQAVIRALELPQPKSVLLLVGDTATLQGDDEAHLVQLFSRGVARALADMNALIIDGGRQTALSDLMGQAVADRGRKSALLGVAAADRVSYPGQPDAGANREPLDSNHSHFILTDGSETDTLFKVADALANPRSVVTLLVGGDSQARRQILESVRLGWPVIALRGSGGLADEIAALNRKQPAFIPAADLAEIIIDGKLYVAQLRGPISAFQRLLEQVLSLQDADDELSTLELVWQRFAMYDKNANLQQRDFNRVQVAILALGVIATFLALLETTLKINADVLTNPTFRAIDQVLFFVLLLIPITITALIAAANRFSAGNKWILLRAGAESLKKEIYRYRTRVEIYSDRETRSVSREMKLHRKEEMLSRKLMQTEVNVAALKPYTGPIPPANVAVPGDDGLSFLTPERYITYRVDDQLNYYQRKAVKLEQRLKRLQWLIYLFGGVGTLLVAMRLELWIALTTGLVAALATYMEYKKIEETLMRYNQTATELSSIRSWWVALSSEEQADPANLDKLVGQTETTIHSEHAQWVQEMQDAMAELRAEQTEELKRQKENTTSESS